MKYLITLAIGLCWLTALPQSEPKTILLTRKGDIITEVAAVDNSTSDRALRIASYIFSSKEFQDSVAQLTFPGKNYCKGLFNRTLRKKPVTGKLVLDLLFKEKQMSLSLYMEQVGKQPTAKDCQGLGATNPGEHAITSYYDNIYCDMGNDLPFAAAYGVHLCHEYTHDVGFCHTNNKVESDVTEAVGWIAYHFAKKWYMAKDAKFLGLLN